MMVRSAYWESEVKEHALFFLFLIMSPFAFILQPVTVTLRGLSHSSAKTTVAVNAEKASWEIAVTSVKRTISTIGLGLAARNVQHVTGW